MDQENKKEREKKKKKHGRGPHSHHKLHERVLKSNNHVSLPTIMLLNLSFHITKATSEETQHQSPFYHTYVQVNDDDRGHFILYIVCVLNVTNIIFMGKTKISQMREFA